MIQWKVTENKQFLRNVYFFFILSNLHIYFYEEHFNSNFKSLQIRQFQYFFNAIPFKKLIMHIFICVTPCVEKLQGFMQDAILKKGREECKDDKIIIGRTQIVKYFFVYYQYSKFSNIAIKLTLLIFFAYFLNVSSLHLFFIALPTIVILIVVALSLILEVI